MSISSPRRVGVGATVEGGELNIASQAQGDILYFNGTSWIRLAKGTALQVLRTNAGTTAPEWAAASAGGIFAELGDTTCTGGESTVSFTSISASYPILKVFILAKNNSDGGAGSDYAYFQFNADAGNNYFRLNTYGNGTLVSTSQSNSNLNLLNTSSTVWGYASVEIANFSASLVKAFRSYGGCYSTDIRSEVGYWNETSNLINRIDITLDKDFAAGCRVILVGALV